MINLKEKLVIAIMATVLGSQMVSLSVEAAPAVPETKTSSTVSENKTTSAVSRKLKDIHEACSTRAACETDRSACVIDFNSEEHPYDVYYDYGEDYEAYIDACDWFLVFDAEYYAETFPMLALQYHNDEEQLLKHFQTVGVHEGRQGCEDFNVSAYLFNCKYSVYKEFQQDYAAYYIYYMLHYNTEKKVNTKTADNGKDVPKQHIAVLTWFQAKELEEINAYREEVGADPVAFDSELAAFANYRCYNNAVEGYKAHDWMTDKKDLLHQCIDTISTSNWCYMENTTTTWTPHPVYETTSIGYRKSPSHYEAMTDSTNHYAGISNRSFNVSIRTGSQFDVYLNVIDTPLHPAD